MHREIVSQEEFKLFNYNFKRSEYENILVQYHIVKEQEYETVLHYRPIADRITLLDDEIEKDESSSEEMKKI